METPLRPDRHQNESPPGEVQRAKEIAVGRLLDRGLDVADSASPEQVVELVDAVDRFDAAVRQRGCDPFTNTLDSSAPDDPDCVLPVPRGDEAIESYIVRVRRQAEMLEQRNG